MTKIYDKFSRRSLVTAIIALAATPPLDSRAQGAKIPRVLFVCQFGTVKSAIAREMFRRRARERNISVVAFSRGITPEDHVTPELRANLAADNIVTTRDSLRRLARRDLASADVIVIFNPLPREFLHTAPLDWSDVPSVNAQYANAHADLAVRIEALLDTLASRH
jgi:protein-tyrosine-phosphatase